MCATGLSQVTYSTKKFVDPPRWLNQKGHGLCVFTDLLYVRWFIIPYIKDEYRVWEVEAKGRLIKKPPFCNISLLAEGEMKKSFTHLKGANGEPYPYQFAAGTEFYRKVKLIMEVQV